MLRCAGATFSFTGKSRAGASADCTRPAWDGRSVIFVETFDAPSVETVGAIQLMRRLIGDVLQEKVDNGYFLAAESIAKHDSLSRDGTATPEELAFDMINGGSLQ